jgi:ribosomal-protein-alanine N-acetyltransferase
MLEPNFSPFPLLTTKRLLLGRIQDNDAAALLSLRSDEKVMQFIDKERTKTIAEATTLIKRITDDANNNEGITWHISLKDDPEKLVGTIGLWRIIKQHYRAEIGYMLHPQLWGRGFMREALDAVIDFGFNIQLHSIEAHINPSNIASASILEKMGFIREAYFKEDYYFRGKFLDSAIYSLLKTRIKNTDYTD